MDNGKNEEPYEQYLSHKRWKGDITLTREKSKKQESRWEGEEAKDNVLGTLTLHLLYLIMPIIVYQILWINIKEN